MNIRCVKKESEEGMDVTVELHTPYKRGGSHSSVTLTGTYDETKHLIVGKTYKIQLIEIEEIVESQEEVPGIDPETIEDFLKVDPVTMAVDKCNKIFASNSITEGLFVAEVGTPAEGTNVAFGRRDGKLYTAATLEEIDKFI